MKTNKQIHTLLVANRELGMFATFLKTKRDRLARRLKSQEDIDNMENQYDEFLKDKALRLLKKK